MSTVTERSRINILLVDDQPAKLLAYEAILKDLDENLLIASSGRAALESLLRNDVAVILIDVCMPELDGFELASMIREHPRFQKTAIIFVSAIQVTDLDRLRGYEMGAVDYLPVPLVPEVLRAKIRVFTELYRKTRQLEQLNAELEARVRARTAELEASNIRLVESEQRRTLALAAGKMGSWDWDRVKNDHLWDEGQYQIFGVDPQSFAVRLDTVRPMIHPEDIAGLRDAIDRIHQGAPSCEVEFRIIRSDGEVRWCLCTAASTLDGHNNVVRVSGVTVDITERKKAEERQALLAREVDHRAKNALALVQSIVRLTRADDIPSYIKAVEGRITALARVHTVLAQARWQGADIRGLIDEELDPYQVRDTKRVSIDGPSVLLQPTVSQTLALSIHELATNAAKYGALSVHEGHIDIRWYIDGDDLRLTWEESGGPAVSEPTTRGFGTRSVIASIETQLQGEANFEWRPKGLICQIRIPDQQSLPVASKGIESSGHRAETAELAFTGSNVLLVEDEVIVAMTMNDILTDLGYSVQGPLGRLSDAFASALEHRPDVAILDVNLNGEMIYPLAEFLIEKNVPVLLVTGYGADGIDRRFAKLPLLQKPLDRHILERMFPAIAASDITRPSHRSKAYRVRQ
nr:response regulator [Bradyrhizobium prioritasuperba]